MLAFIIAKHCIFYAFDDNLAPFSFLFMFNPPLYVYFVEMKKTRQKSSNLDKE